MKNRWNDADAKAAVKQYDSHSEDIALRVYTSRLIGADPALVLHGGGNTSVKSDAQNRVGETVRTLFVKGSGWDLDTLEPPGLPGVKLEPLLKLRGLDNLSDEDMVNEQRINLLDAGSPNPSVETLLHAFLPHKFVDHSHADAILVIANQPDVKSLCREIFAGAIGWVPYIMPGFLLAKAAAKAYERDPNVKGLLLENHGLFTFGETAQESYDRHIEAVSQAEDFIASKKNKKLTPANGGGNGNPLTALAPVLRGLYEEKTGAAWVLHHREDAAARAFAESEQCRSWSQVGTATPDHVIRTKQKPLLLNVDAHDAEKLRAKTAKALEAYIAGYRDYFKTCQQSKGVQKKELDPLPRVLLVAGAGLVTIGKTTKETKIAADIYQHTIDIIRKAYSVGEYTPLNASDLFDMEYWSLEQAKLGRNKAKKLQGRIVLISGAASGIGLATARLFGANGANLFLLDRDADALQTARDALVKETGASVTTQTCDVTDEAAVTKAFERLVAALWRPRHPHLQRRKRRAGQDRLRFVRGAARKFRSQFLRPPEPGFPRRGHFSQTGKRGRAVVQRLQSRVQPRQGFRPLRPAQIRRRRAHQAVRPRLRQRRHPRQRHQRRPRAHRPVHRAGDTRTRRRARPVRRRLFQKQPFGAGSLRHRRGPGFPRPCAGGKDHRQHPDHRRRQHRRQSQVGVA